MGVQERIQDFLQNYDIKKVVLGGVVVIGIGVVVVLGIGKGMNPQPEEGTPDINTEVTVPQAYDSYKETGINTAEVTNYSETGQPLPQGFHIIGDYTDEYNQISVFTGFYQDAGEREQVSGVRGVAGIIYVDGQGNTHEVMGSDLSELLAVQEQYQ